eukprot:m.331203 g.331203  ORF g.331203 m.331203 type:complete len:396 (-) comp16672_c0_seq1:335-1522(-)
MGRWGSRGVGFLWIASICTIVFGILPWGIYELQTQHAEPHVQAWFTAGVFVSLAVPITVWDVAQHLRHWANPALQTYVIRMLWMVPIYAINSWLALRFVGVGIYLNTVRECYEAYVIYNFLMYLLTFLRQQDANFLAKLEHRPPVKHLFPFGCFKPWPMGPSFLARCKLGPIIYVVFRLLTTAAALLCEVTGKYREGEIRIKSAWIYLAVINCTTQSAALYCMIMFYFAFKKELEPARPVSKIFVIKAVVFASFWQSVLIAILAASGAIPEDPTWTNYNRETVAAGLQDFLICVEMFLAALAHRLVFSYTEYLDALSAERFERLTFTASLSQLFDVSDVQEDVFGSLRIVIGGSENSYFHPSLRSENQGNKTEDLMENSDSDEQKHLVDASESDA